MAIAIGMKIITAAAITAATANRDRKLNRTILQLFIRRAEAAGSWAPGDGQFDV
jgi:hypothetical protein